MRKYVIYCLVFVLMLGITPKMAYAVEDNWINKVVIYPNGKKIFLFNENEENNFILGNVTGNYYVDYNNNQVNINFDEPVFLSDIISEGDTIHQSIIINNIEEIEVNEELATSSYSFAAVENLILKYEDVSDVYTITLTSDTQDFTGGLLDNAYFKINNSNSITKSMTDNNLNTSARVYGGTVNTTPTYYVYYFTDTVNIKGFKIAYKYYTNQANVFSVKFRDNDNNILYTKSFSGKSTVKIEDILVNIKNVKSILINAAKGQGGVIYEFNAYEKIMPEPEEVKNLNYTIDNNFQIILTWDNPEEFEAIKIYRNDQYITTTTNNSFTETLTPGTYQYKIITVLNEKESQGITTDNIEIAYKAPPTTVKGIRVINKTATGGEITWNLNPEYEQVIKYAIYVNGQKHGETKVPPYILEGLEEGKSYTISVQAVNEYGVSEPPTTITYIPALPDLGETIQIGDVFANVSTLFNNIWSLLALGVGTILSPRVYKMIKKI